MNNLEKEFVPYELFLELKQLGFDEPCLAYHNIDPYLKSPAFNLCKPFDHEWYLPAPLYQQAFRWFREEYDLFGCIDLQVCTPSHWFIRVDKIEINDYLYHSEDENIRFNTYEEAELACLRKLIEIVKEKK